MLVCFVCNANVGCHLKNLFLHLKNLHGIKNRNAKYTCRQGMCCRSFSEKYVFSKHIMNNHKQDIEDETSSTSIYNTAVDVDENASGMLVATNEVVIEPHTELDIMELAASFISEAKSRVTSLSNVHAIVLSCKNMFAHIMDDLINEVKLQTQTSNAKSEHFDILLAKMNKYKNPFLGVETEYSHCAYLERAGLFIKPDKYIVGSRQSFKKDEITGITKPVMEPVDAQFVSIGNTIKALNARTNLVREAAAAARLATVDEGNTLYSSFLDGSVWKAHPLRGGDVIIIRLYGDDFEPANPLGSRKSLYKIGCIYFQLECLPNHILSKTENMFLTLCYNTNDVKEFGWEYILRPLVTELKVLESRGISLTNDDETRSFKVILSGITGDNLFLNGILGFVESFTASYPCRHCTTRRPEFKNKVMEKEAPDDLRVIRKLVLISR